MEKDLSKSYKEVNVILDLLGAQYKNKVPKKMRTLFLQSEDKTYSPEITLDDFYAGNYLEDTKTILAILNINYWSNMEQKSKYMDKIRELDAKYREEHRPELNELFPKKEYEPVEPNYTEKQIAEKTGFAQKIMEILEKLKSLFKK